MRLSRLWTLSCRPPPGGSPGASFLAAALLSPDISALLSDYLFEGRKLASSHDQSPKRFLNSTFSFFAVPYVSSYRRQCPPKILLLLSDRKGHETRQELATGGL